MRPAEEVVHVAAGLRQMPAPQALRLVERIRERTAAAVAPLISVDARRRQPLDLADRDTAAQLAAAAQHDPQLLPAQRARVRLLHCCTEILARGALTDALRDWLLLELAATDPAHDIEPARQRNLRAGDVTAAERARILEEFERRRAREPAAALDDLAAAIAVTHQPVRSPRTIRAMFPTAGTRGRPPKNI